METLVGHENVLNANQSSSEAVVAGGKTAMKQIERRLSSIPGYPPYNGTLRCRHIAKHYFAVPAMTTTTTTIIPSKAPTTTKNTGSAPFYAFFNSLHLQIPASVNSALLSSSTHRVSRASTIVTRYERFEYRTASMHLLTSRSSVAIQMPALSSTVHEIY